MTVRDKLQAKIVSAGGAVVSAGGAVISSAGGAVISAGGTVISAGGTVINYLRGQQSTRNTTEDVLRAEYKEIWGEDLPEEKAEEKVEEKPEEKPKEKPKEKPEEKPEEKVEEKPKAKFEETYRKNVQAKNQAALCLSGGGIRSGAFSLGVLQVLARHGLLTQFQYLSTVSGGGYIGGWLSRWIAGEPDQNVANVETVLARKGEILQVSSLRANSNFLTPKTGITSADTWTGILLWLRNVLLNWTVFIPALIFAVLAPNFYLALMIWFADLAQAPDDVQVGLFGLDLAEILLWIGGISLIFATWQAVRNIPSHRNGDGWSGRVIGWQIVVPLLLWAALLPLVLVAGGYKVTPEAMTVKIFGRPEPILVWVLVFSFFAKIAGYVLAGLTNRRNLGLYFRNAVTWAVASAVATGALWFTIAVIDSLSRVLLAAGATPRDRAIAIVYALTILGPLGANLAHILLSTLYVGFRHVGFQDDADREWLARLSAVSVFPALLWAVFALICLLLPFIFIHNHWLLMRAPTWGPTIDNLVKALGVISGFVAVLGGQSASVKLDISNAAPKSGSTKANELIVRLATLFFIAFLFMALADVERIIAEGLGSAAEKYHQLSAICGFLIPRLLVFLIGFVPVYLLWYLGSRRELLSLWSGIGVLAVVSVIGWHADELWAWFTNPVYGESAKTATILLYSDSAKTARILQAQGLIAAGLFLLISITSVKIDVNRFSMHGVYRNRLVRAFLGAARAGRKPDPFTDFDAADNCRVHELKAQKAKCRVLYPVINVTLNLVGGENLAWQERKASSFIITPLYCGSAALGDEVAGYVAANDPCRRVGAYVKAENYGGKEPDLNDDKTGISLGTALTISGAAASPSMGYNSAPATAFLMTLFNVRLGAWLANPAAENLKDQVKAGPTSALKPLLTEALGLTDAKSSNVYLSDGGHFDNLGIYEMIRRRCRYILVVDADADENFAFEDLARSVRFAAIDLDAKIEFAAIEMKSVHDARANSKTFAVGKITYAESPADASWLIYLKPTYFYENAPVDVRSYGTVNDKFPHESTLDQWFGESQFECYRRLGEYLMDELYERRDKTKLADGTKATMEKFFNAVRSAALPGTAGATISPLPSHPASA